MECACGWKQEPFRTREQAAAAYREHLRSAQPICRRCKQQKMPHQMSKSSTHLCKPCRTATTREWAEAHPKQWERHGRRYHLRDKYGMTLDEYEALLASQGGVCAICSRPPSDSRGFRMHVDHCHDTGVVRGILCGPSNQGLGNLRDDPEVVRLALDYLLRHAKERIA